MTISPKQREELLRVLKARFEKNMNRHKGMEWAKVQAKLEADIKFCGHSMKWKKLAVNRTLSVMTRRRMNTFFMIAQQKVLKAAEMFVTIVRDRRQGKHLNLKITLLIWRLP